MNITALIATLGVMALPLGVYLFVETDDRLFGVSFFVVGILMLVFSMYRVWLDEKEERDRRNKRDEISDNRFELQTTMLAGILSELKGLRKEGQGYVRRIRKK